MHIALHALFDTLPDNDFANHVEVFEALLLDHLNERNLFCLTPGQVVRIRGLDGLGLTSRKALEIIASRCQDYLASLRFSQACIRLLPEGENNTLPSQSEFLLSPQAIQVLIEGTTALFIENANSDGRIYRALITHILNDEYPVGHLVKVRPFHGGGNTLGDVVAQTVGNLVRGMSICDRDKCGTIPPLKTNSTSSRLAQALLDIGVIRDNLTATQNFPLYFFHVTFGWSLENYIGPNLTDLVATILPLGHFDRNAFVTAFPTFPHLSADESRRWFLINFRDQNQSATTLIKSARDRFGLVLSTERATHLAALYFPGNLIGEAGALLISGRYVKSAKEALNRDLSNEVYRASLSEVVASAHASLAGDSRVRFS